MPGQHDPADLDARPGRDQRGQDPYRRPDIVEEVRPTDRESARPDPPVLRCDHEQALVGQRGGQRTGVSAVPLGPPEPAVEE